MRFHGKAVTIICTDLRRSEHFYWKVLGAEPLPTDQGALPWYQLGALTLTIMPNAAEPSPASFPEHAMSMLFLEVDDLALAHEHLKAHKVPIDDYHKEEFLIARDPDGLLLEIWQV